MASVAVARLSSVRAGASVATRGLRSISASGQPTPRASAPFVWVAGKRCMSTKFAESHEYIKMEGGTGTVGITHYAQNSLGDIVFVDLPSVGDKFEAGESFGSVESVKAASDVYSPANGEVVEINEALQDAPGMINEDPEGKGWFIKVKVDGELPDSLLDKKDYAALLEKQD